MRTAGREVARAGDGAPAADDLATLLDAADAVGDRLAAPWAMAVYSGCRQSALLGLRWDDLNLDAVRLTVPRTLARIEGGRPVSGKRKTTCSRRIVRIPAAAVRSSAPTVTARTSGGAVWAKAGPTTG
jgi:integrase